MKLRLAPLLGAATTAAAATASRRQLETDGGCYTFQSPVDTVEEMEAVCQELGGHVAYTTDPELFADLNTFAFEQSGEATNYSWVLGLVAQKACTYMTLDGSAPKYLNWEVGQPNQCDSCSGEFDTSKDAECCVEVHRDGTWNDMPCAPGQSKPFFCETETCEEVCTKAVDCELRLGYAANGVCYTLQDAKASMADAEAHCQSLGGHVAFSSDGDLLQAMNEFALETTTDTWWLGINAQDNCTFTTLDGDRFRYTNWRTGEPNGCETCQGEFDPDGECCVHVYSDGEWNDIDCDTDTPLPYFCEIPVCEEDEGGGGGGDDGGNPCREDGEVDDDCCAVPSSAGCADGYTYSYDSSRSGMCVRSDDWKAYTTVCTPCVDAFDAEGAAKPWYDFVSCAEEAEFCDDNEDVRVGCAKTCGACGEDGTDMLGTTTTDAGTRWTGAARLTFEGCVGCDDFYGGANAAATAADALDWEDCLDAGLTVRMTDEEIKLVFDDDVCGEAMSPGPKQYGDLSAHAVGFLIVDDDAGELPVYVIAMANAGDGSVQLVWNILELEVTLTMEFSIRSLQGTFLGWDEVPDGESPSASDGAASLTLLDYVDSDPDDDANTCGFLLENACDGLQGAMMDGDFTLSITDTDVFMVSPRNCSSTDTPIYSGIQGINGGAFVVHGDGYLIVYVGEPEENAVSVFFLAFESGTHCLYAFQVDAVKGAFLGFTDGEFEADEDCAEVSCNDISCEDWKNLGVSAEALFDATECDACNDCLPSSVGEDCDWWTCS